ncbi:hypothetical protein HYT01_01615 [Candidatus Giovannonibacteria bacterium]|nr:hypothetical protein [Candidatus Giovannonibacteria bacterium]
MKRLISILFVSTLFFFGCRDNVVSAKKIPTPKWPSQSPQYIDMNVKWPCGQVVIKRWPNWSLTTLNDQPVIVEYADRNWRKVWIYKGNRLNPEYYAIDVSPETNRYKNKPDGWQHAADRMTRVTMELATIGICEEYKPTQLTNK